MQFSRVLFCTQLVLVLLGCCLPGEAEQRPLPALLPMPATVVPGNGSLPLAARLSVDDSGCRDPRVEASLQRIVQRLTNEIGQPLALKRSVEATDTTLAVACRLAGNSVPRLRDDEAYTLEVTDRGIRIIAESAIGALRGLETFAQLIIPGPESFQLPFVHIEDRPRFAWRGLMLDTSRHWISVPVLERNLDAMAAVKLNVFHWHLSDDQGFRVEIRRFPKLQEVASGGRYYTREDIRHVVAYAAERGIRVVPEIDVPGHASAILAAYPELGSSAAPYQIANGWGIFKPTLNPAEERVYQFLDGVFAEMAELFPEPYFHIGGDEIEGSEWTSNPGISAFKKAHGMLPTADDPAANVALHAYFNRRVEDLLKKYGKTAVGWEEVLQPGISDGVVIQSWRGQQTLVQAARKGHPSLLSFGYYLDYLQSAATYYGVDPLAGDAAQLGPDQARLVLGGEACMWAEFANDETIDSRVWPSAAAVAERLWSEKPTDVASMYRRLDVISRKLEWVGLRHRANYEPMLTRIGGGVSHAPLRVLADALQPKGMDREFLRHYTPATPLNRLVDALRPESETVRQLREAATKVQADPSSPAADELKAAFSAWAANDSRLQPLLDGNFLLQELAPASKAVSEIGEVGLQALEYLRSGRAAPPSWLADRRKRMKELSDEKSEMIFAGIEPVRLLLDSLEKKTAEGN